MAALAIAIVASPASAGPPYLTDDPAPTEVHHWEIYSFTDNNLMHEDHEGEAGFDISYGLARNLQVTTTITGAYERGDDHGLRAGDAEIGVKYRFINREADGLQLSFYPTFILPTAPGGGKVAYALPIWAQKDYGKWSVFGGGGPTIHPGADKRFSWEEGIALTRRLTEDLTLGVEIAHEGSEADGGHGTTTAQLGGTMHLRGPLSLYAAAGPRFETGTGRTGAHFYVGLLTAF